MRRKKIKLQNLDAELRSTSTNNPPIFRGIVVHVNGYTQPSLSDLHRLIVSHGGGFLQYLDGKTAVTHVIASSLTPKKKVDFARYRIVKPAWIVESVKAGRLLPWDSFRVVDEGVTQKVLGFEKGQVISQTNTQRQGYREQTDGSWYTSQVKKDLNDLSDARESEQFKMTGAGTGSGPEHDIKHEISEQVHVARQDWPETAERTLVHGNVSGDATCTDPVNRGFPGADPGNSVADELRNDERFPPDSEFADIHDGDAEEGEGIQGRDFRKNGALVVPAAHHATSRSPEQRQMTAEEHNAVLLSDPHLAKSSTANPDFLNQYYRESRLHHLSIWKADLKAQLQARAQERSFSQKFKRVPGTRRYILHVDFDSFFAAVSLRKNPQLVEKPVAIAHGTGPSSEIASCNYPAREFGIKNGMWMKSAMQLCPDLKVLPYDFKAYEEASRHFYESILATDGIVQSVSIDEALVDISRQCIEAGGSDGKSLQEASLRREQAKASEIAESLRALVREKTCCNVSIGIGNNILLAKVALRKAKPAGQYLLKPEDILDFIGELMVTDLPGVAYSLGGKLEEMGVKYVKDLRALTKERLVNSLGPKTGEKLWEYSRGIDKVEVGEQVIRKSVSAEVNWGIRFVTQQQADEFVQCLCDELSRRLVDQTVKGKQLAMKIMRRAAGAPMDPPKNLGHGKCDTFNKSVILGVATNDKALIGREALSILKGFGFSPGEIRGLGVQMTKLEPLKPTAPSTSAAFDSSQRRLQFKRPGALPDLDPTHELTQMVRDERSANGPIHYTPPEKQRHMDTIVSLEEVPTIEHRTTGAALPGFADNGNASNDDSEHSLLNITGSQFILPSQFDPSILAELPQDICAKLAPRQQQIIESLAPRPSPQSANQPKSRSVSPQSAVLPSGLPNQSQIDPDILSALPEDVRAELLAHYENGVARSKFGGASQQLLPQSPRKPIPIFSSKKAASTPSKKPKTSKPFGRGKSMNSTNSVSTLTQSNFVAIPKATAKHDQSGSTLEEEASESFLAELPEELRLEIIAEQRRNRIKVKSGLNLGASRKKAVVADQSSVRGLEIGQSRLRLPSGPERPTFTSRKLSTLSDLREAMTGWIEEFSGEGEEGPFEEDVDALAEYLEKVVTIELDMEKAVSIVEWVIFVCHDREMSDEQLRDSWKGVLERLKNSVQGAVRTRGLPAVDFAGS